MATAFRYGNPVVEFAGAQVRSQCRQLATVVTVVGDIDSNNVDLLIRHVTRSIIREKPFILDLSGVASFAPIATALLTAVDEACRRTADEWLLVPSETVSWELEGDFPTASSVPDALHCFSDAMTERRQLLPMLAKSA
ncbi:STAS domain-containing protein [Mycolicibacterium mengxianglii]|uniref:STAS domain-containing protein n=1 Tax=Mycolicibacterium mengxianglii TaxID=2736649 RepID=UPI0018EF150A|nr:STAS domain-containing protein [Mycolicibacterium mengxianglii]